MPDETELLDAIKNYRDREFASIITVMVGIAAETHPEALRAALGKVFDLGALESEAKRLAGVLQQRRDEAHQVLELLRAVYRGLDLIEERLDGLEYRAEKLERAAVNGKPQRETVQ